MYFFSYKNAQIHYTDTKSKNATIVFLHGFLEDLSMWKPFETLFAKRFRVICVDLFGHGKSDSLSYIHTMDDMADMVFSLMQFLKINNASFVGHSMGGYVSLAFAKHYTSYTNALVLVNSTALPDSKERIENRDRAISAVKKNKNVAVGMAIANLFYEETRDRFLAEIELLKQIAQKTTIQGIIAAQEGMKIREDHSSLWHTLALPKMLILGRKDPVLNFEETKQQILNTDVTLEVLPLGHMSYIENKDELKTILGSFFEAILS
jgi:pimeloyl-ACP methyl ester carboxylesterase